METPEQLAELFRALGDTTRLRILRLLAEEGELCVCAIMPRLGLPQSTVSHHLATLRHAGVVRHRREGQMMFYSLRNSALLEQAHKTLERILSATGHEFPKTVEWPADAVPNLSSASRVEEMRRTKATS